MLIPLLFGIAASVATLLGGLLALRLRHRIALILGLTAGIVLGVAVFDLIPEALDLTRDRLSVRSLASFMAIGLGLYMLLDRLLGRSQRLPAAVRAHLGPAALTLHSLFDGLGIGFAFQIDTTAGWLVAVAVMTHDLADGVNTVSLCVAANADATAKLWLGLNVLAPFLGVIIGLGTPIRPTLLAPLLAGFAGVFLYIGACELIPRSYALEPRLRTTITSLAGMALMFLVTCVAH